MTDREQLEAALAREAKLRSAIGLVCAEWTLPESVRKILETTLFSDYNDTALNELKAQVKKEALLEAADRLECEESEDWEIDCAHTLRRMAEEGEK